jgi:hypothetical protein
MATIVLNDITKQIKAGKNVDFKLDIIERFEQYRVIPERSGTYVSPVEKQSIESVNIYDEGDIIDIPSGLTNICNLDNYYILGVSHKFHLLESVFYNIDEKFKFEDDSKKVSILDEFKELLKIDNQKNGNKIMEDNYDMDYMRMCAKYFNINILCIDCDNNSYCITEELSGDKQTIILVNMYSKFLPLLHIFGEKPNYSLCSTIIKYFNDK